MNTDFASLCRMHPVIVVAHHPSGEPHHLFAADSLSKAQNLARQVLTPGVYVIWLHGSPLCASYVPGAGTGKEPA